MGRKIPEINASSMADIAFLLLTFFLVATSMEKSAGFIRKIPDPNRQVNQATEINKRNVCKIKVSKDGDVSLRGEKVEVSDIKQKVIEFIDNGRSCSYCKGRKSPNSSDSPVDAVVSLQFDNDSDYNMYISVFDQVEGAYNTLRGNYAKKNFNKELHNLTQKELEELDGKYPKQIGDSRPKDNVTI